MARERLALAGSAHSSLAYSSGGKRLPLVLMTLTGPFVSSSSIRGTCATRLPKPAESAIVRTKLPSPTLSRSSTCRRAGHGVLYCL